MIPHMRKPLVFFEEKQKLIFSETLDRMFLQKIQQTTLSFMIATDSLILFQAFWRSDGRMSRRCVDGWTTGNQPITIFAGGQAIDQSPVSPLLLCFRCTVHILSILPFIVTALLAAFLVRWSVAIWKLSIVCLLREWTCYVNVLLLRCFNYSITWSVLGLKKAVYYHLSLSIWRDVH